MKKRVCLIFAVVFVAGVAAQDLKAEDYPAQTCGGCTGGLLVGAAAGIAALGIVSWMTGNEPDEFGPSDAESNAITGGVLLGYPLGCAMGTATVGSWSRCEGNTGGAYAGAYAPLALGAVAALVAKGAWPNGEAARGILDGTAVATLVLSPVGAAIGYNVGAPRTDSRSPAGARLALPTIAYRTRLGPDRKTYSAFDCRLAAVRF